MCSLKPILRIALAAGVFSGLPPWTARAWALDDVVVDRVDALPPPAENENLGRRRGAKYEYPTPVDQWLFESDQADDIRANMEAAAVRQLGELKRGCLLSDAQVQRLSLAVQSDVNQFFDSVEHLREQFPQPQPDRNSITEEMQQDVMRLHMKFRAGGSGLCGPDSFLEKMLPRVLDDQQLASYRLDIDRRLRERYLSAVEVALQDLENRVPLDSRQHETIRRSLVDRSLPHVTRKWKDLTPLVMFRLAQIPADQLQPLFDDRHWTVFDRYRLPGGSYRNTLQLVGLLPQNE
jgi:hypothetical protein